MSFEITICANNIDRQMIRDWVQDEELSYVVHYGHQVVRTDVEHVSIDSMITYAFKIEADAFRFAMRWA